MEQGTRLRLNRRVILLNLQEAEEELSRMIGMLQEEPNYSEDDFRVAISHLYHHVNFAWNGRHLSDEQYGECTDELFNRCGRFPIEDDLEVGSGSDDPPRP